MATEQRNPASYKIDGKGTEEILRIINGEDTQVAYAIETAIPMIATIVDDVVKAFQSNGRLFYIGAGTSGRLGVLDASECPPTFGVSPSLVQGIIAGGQEALTRSVENAEDDGAAGVNALERVNFNASDVLVGITASGSAPFVIEALKHAKTLGAAVGAISCNEQTDVFEVVDPQRRVFIPVGPEIITGSTRMKAGTAQKLVLNMITTTAMIRTGKVYNNYMVNLMPVNAKLVKRAQRLVAEICGCDLQTARTLFSESGKETKTAIIMGLLDVDPEMARSMLQSNEGSISKVIAAHGVRTFEKEC